MGLPPLFLNGRKFQLNCEWFQITVVYALKNLVSSYGWLSSSLLWCSNKFRMWSSKQTNIHKHTETHKAMDNIYKFCIQHTLKQVWQLCLLTLQFTKKGRKKTPHFSCANEANTNVVTWFRVNYWFDSTFLFSSHQCINKNADVVAWFTLNIWTTNVWNCWHVSIWN